MAALNITDLSNGKLNLDHIDELANSSAATVVDRFGVTKTTVAGAIDSLKAFNSRGAWTPATAYAKKDLVSNGGFWYVCVEAHTSSAAFATDTASKWRVHQGVTSAELLAPDGGTKVNYLPTWSGAAAKNFQIKAIESVSIFEAGGADDWNGTTGTNNFAAFETLCALAPIRIRLPRTNTGVYMLNGSTALTSMAGVIFDADEGVSLYIQGAGAVQANKPGIKSTRALKVYRETGRYGHPMGPHMFEKPSEKSHFMSANAGEIHKPVLLDMATDTYNVKLSAWPNGALARYSPTSTAIDSVQHPIASGVFAATMVNVVPGDQIAAQLYSASSYLPGVMVQTDTGWVVAWAPSGNASISTMELIGGVGVNKSTPQPVLTNLSYNLGNAIVGVHVYDDQSFGLMVNGILIKRYETDGKIVAAGWAVGFSAAACFISNAVMFKNKRTAGLKPLKIVCVGDSTSDRATTLKSQYEFAAQYLTGMGGCQVETLTNLAVSGNTSAQQLTALTSTNVTGYDYGLIQIGINDIQTSAGAAVLANNVESMIAHLRSSNVIPIVGLPTMWYSQADAQAFSQDGAATNNANATAGAQYRLILLRKLATLGVYVNTMVVEDQGAVVASLLAYANGDPVLFDNIHPTIYGTMLMGYSWAKAIAAHMGNSKSGRENASTLMDRAWFVGAAGTTATPRYTVREGVLQTLWYLSRNSESWADGTTIGTLPPRLRPGFEIVFPVVCVDASTIPVVGAAYVKIGSNGVMKVYGIAAAAIFISFNASWRI